MNLKLLIPILVVALISLDMIQSLVKINLTLFTKKHFDSVSSFGYGPSRHSSIYSSVDDKYSFEKINHPILSKIKTRGGQILYIDGKTWSRHSGEKTNNGVALITGMKKIALFYLDTEDIEIIKEYKRENIERATPAIDTSRGLIYYMTKKYMRVINFKGEELSIIPSPLNKPLSKSFEVAPSYNTEMSYCSTSIGIYQKKDKNIIYIGCSGKTWDFDKNQDGYGTQKGGVGLMATYHTDKNGLFVSDVDKRKIFLGSKITKRKWSGYNTGLWMGGSSPSLDKDGNIYPIWANGLVYPEEENYGCTLTRVNLESNKIEKLNSEDLGYLTTQKKGYQECYIGNLEWGSSGGPIAKINNKQFIFLKGKLSHLTAVQTNKLHGYRDETKLISYRVNQGLKDNSISSPTIIPKAETLIVGVASEYRGRRGGSFIGEKRVEKIILEDINTEINKGSKCIGYAFSQKRKDTVAYNFWYSGNYYKQLFLAEAGSELEKKLSNWGEKNYFVDHFTHGLKKTGPPFIKIGPTFYLAKRSFRANKDFEKIPLVKILKKHQNVRSSAKSLSEKEARNLIVDKYYNNSHYLLKSKEKNSPFRDCTLSNKSLFGLSMFGFEFKEDIKKDVNWKVDLLEFDGESFRNLKTFKPYGYLQNSKILHSNPLLSYDSDLNPLYMYVPIHNSTTNSSGFAIAVIDLKKSKVKEVLELDHEISKSLPTLIGKWLLVSTVRGRPYIFKAKLNIWKTFIENLVVYKIFS